jgi:hypothetical protein
VHGKIRRIMALEPEIILAAISSIATLAGGLQSALADKAGEKIAQWMYAKLHKSKERTDGNGVETSEVRIGGDIVGGDKNVVIAVSDGLRIARGHLELRLEQIERAKKTQQRLSNAFTWSSNLLTFAQYVVGGVLATSFIQQKLSANLIGFFGLIVLISSIVKQHYRPEVKAKLAIQKTAKLQALIRDSEDKVAQLRAMGTIEPKEFLDLASQISATLSKIDHADAELSFEKKAITKKKSKVNESSADS